MSNVLTDTTWSCNGRHITAGTELSIKGERGRFAFRHFAISDKGEWITVYGGPNGRESFRSFDPSRVSRVHRSIKQRADVLPKPRRSNIR